VDCGGRKEAQVQPYSPGVERHLANTIEPFICGGDAVLSNYFDHLFLLVVATPREQPANGRVLRLNKLCTINSERDSIYC